VQGDILCLYSAGAYGFVMSSNYNSRPRAAEVMIDGSQMHRIRARETLQDLVRGEQLLPVD
jgi:diaminopimelate decarboxylase